MRKIIASRATAGALASGSETRNAEQIAGTVTTARMARNVPF